MAFNDNVREDYPLLSQSKWNSVLQDQGFSQTVFVNGSAKNNPVSQPVIVSQLSPDYSLKETVPTSGKRRWLVVGEIDSF